MVAVRERHKPLCYSSFMLWKEEMLYITMSTRTGSDSKHNGIYIIA